MWPKINCPAPFLSDESILSNSSNWICFLYSQSVSNSWQTVADHVKTTEFTVKDLRPNTVYLFIIRAVNAQGLGDPSPMSEPVRTQGTKMDGKECSLICIPSSPPTYHFILSPRHQSHSARSRPSSCAEGVGGCGRQHAQPCGPQLHVSAGHMDCEYLVHGRWFLYLQSSKQ